MSAYTLDDVTVEKGHVMTTDGRYYLAMDGHFDYWHRVKARHGTLIRLDYPMGRYSYDYCFRSNLPGCIEKLNTLLTLH